MTSKTGPEQRHDGRWLAYLHGLPLMWHDYSNKTFKTQQAAERAIQRKVAEDEGRKG